MPAKRELIDTGTDKRYVRPDDKGRFKESHDVGRSLRQDRKQQAKTKSKPGQGQGRSVMHNPPIFEAPAAQWPVEEENLKQPDTQDTRAVPGPRLLWGALGLASVALAVGAGFVARRHGWID